MDKEKIKKYEYDGAVIRIGARLETFLDKHAGGEEKKIETFAEKCSVQNRKQIISLMHLIRNARNKVAHDKEGWDSGAPVFDFGMFQKVRRALIQLDDILKDENAHAVGAKNIMLMSAADQFYTMGNAGDFIKHGMLILLLNWLAGNRREVRYADPFGGNPWTKLENQEIKRRLNDSVRRCAFMRHAWSMIDGKYYGSGQIALHKGAHVWVADKDMHRRSDLEASGLFMLDEVLDNYDNQNGYCILSPEAAGDFDLILIDPLGDFMTERFDELDSAIQAVNKNPRLFVMFFVLDLQSKNKPPQTPEIYANHKNFMDKREKMREFACSLRCPKIENRYGIKGESRHEYEILAISQEFQNGGASDLWGKLRYFAANASDILPLQRGEKVEFWGGKDE